MTEQQPRLLVAGGPVERRVNHILAAVVGVMIGGGLGIGGTAIIALKAAHEVKTSRVRSVQISCREANERHVSAQVGLRSLVAKTARRHQSAAEAKKTREIVDAFVNALAPSYDCAERVKMLTKP
jgi:hypothetical protein